MKSIISYIKLWFLPLLCIPPGCAQNPTDIHIPDPEFEQRLSRILNFSVPVISVDSLRNIDKEYILLDTRNRKEYETSHISGASFLDYSKPDFTDLENLPRDQTIVLYCSIGYRSEKTGQKLQKMGFTRVYNLYGSIFEWVNQGYPVVNMQGKATNRVHAYSKSWANYIRNTHITKVW